jgi:hypothetical protein
MDPSFWRRSGGISKWETFVVLKALSSFRQIWSFLVARSLKGYVTSKQVIWTGKDIHSILVVEQTQPKVSLSSFSCSEVNLKIKQALSETSHIVSPPQLSQLHGVIKSEQPNNRLYNYDGTLALAGDGGKSKDLPLDPNKLLLRGAQLRNTSWIYGVAIFTGHESKLMLNSR